VIDRRRYRRYHYNFLLLMLLSREGEEYEQMYVGLSESMLHIVTPICKYPFSPFTSQLVCGTQIIG